MLCLDDTRNNNNSIQFSLLTCKLNSPEANYRASTGEEKQNTKQLQGGKMNKSVNPLTQRIIITSGNNNIKVIIRR
jgi:hypothetical protein